jgi:hypothetical protein
MGTQPWNAWVVGTLLLMLPAKPGACPKAGMGNASKPRGTRMLELLRGCSSMGLPLSSPLLLLLLLSRGLFMPTRPLLLPLPLLLLLLGVPLPLSWQDGRKLKARPLLVSGIGNTKSLLLRGLSQKSL